MEYPDINTMSIRLYERWGEFTITAVFPRLWICANEGLGTCRVQFEGDSPVNAVQKAYRTIARLYPAGEQQGEGKRSPKKRQDTWNRR